MLTSSLVRATNPMAKLTTEQRKALPKSDFVFPDKAPGSGSYPIPDKSHAMNALARSAGKPEEAAVKAAVRRRYPGLMGPAGQA
jgi:hypothetical protein